MRCSGCKRDLATQEHSAKCRRPVPKERPADEPDGVHRFEVDRRPLNSRALDLMADLWEAAMWAEDDAQGDAAEAA